MVHWAAQKGHTEVARVVIDDYKLDPTARDKVRAFDVCSKSLSRCKCGWGVSGCLCVYCVVIADFNFSSRTPCTSHSKVLC